MLQRQGRAKVKRFRPGRPRAADQIAASAGARQIPTGGATGRPGPRRLPRLQADPQRLRAYGITLGRPSALAPGIEPLAQAALFTRFYQESPERPRSKSGLGLGLYIARSIIEQHGGTIEVCSAVGEGSTFTIRLPLAELVAGTRCHGEGPVGREDGGGYDG